MHYVYDPAQNNTVLLTLMQGGILSSFEIESFYHIPPFKKTPIENQTNESNSSANSSKDGATNDSDK